MKVKTNRLYKSWLLLPILGTVLFIFLYINATLLYPGGSQIDKHSVGFSWLNNYWCNLLNETAINGQINPAKPIAITGLIILCISLTFFWFLLPKHLNIGKVETVLLKVSGTLAMAIATLLMTTINHDLITNLTSFFGLIAVVLTFSGLYKNRFYGLFAFGMMILLLVAVNNYCYYSKDLIIYLPVIQKVSFAFFLIWICSICIFLFLRAEKGITYQ